MLSVYFDDLDSPVITTFIDVASTLQLNNSRAYVGFTAATGRSIRAFPHLSPLLLGLF